MFLFALFSKKKKRRVLEAANSGVLSAREISRRAKVSESETEELIRRLESVGYLSSGYLVPVRLKIYRVTSLGRQALAEDRAI